MLYVVDVLPPNGKIAMLSLAVSVLLQLYRIQFTGYHAGHLSKAMEKCCVLRIKRKLPTGYTPVYQCHYEAIESFHLFTLTYHFLEFNQTILVPAGVVTTLTVFYKSYSNFFI